MQTYTFTTEAQARSFWHHLSMQMGNERLSKNCSIALTCGTYVITVTASDEAA